MTSIVSRHHRIRMIIGLSIVLVIASIHMFRASSYLEGAGYTLYYSYASDVTIPFGFYFLLCMNEINYLFLRKWYVKATIIFGLSSLTEILQAFGIHFLGVTFDPVDIIMFAVGVLVAVILDQLILKRAVPYWDWAKR